jgi:protease-4
MGPADATSFGAIPSYYEHLDFNLTGPTGFTESVGGYANPSVYPMMPGAETEFYWSSYRGDEFENFSRWGLFLGLENVGFGVVHAREPFTDGDRSVTDYRLGLGWGTGAVSSGIGYGWAGGDGDAFGRENFVQLGLTGRFHRYASLGVNGNFSTQTDASQGLFDLAVRPLGDDRVTLFGDLEFAYQHGDRIDSEPWSVGAMLEIPSGLKLVGRYFDDEGGADRGFSVGLAYTFGGNFGQGVVRGSYVPRFDRDNDLVLTNWGVRMGYPERARLLAPLYRDSGYLKMHVQGEPPYTRYRFLDSRTTFYEIIEALQDARTDGRVAGVALNLSGTKLSRGAAWEIRSELAKAREAGKKVVVFIDEAGMSTYYVASVADHVVIDPEGLLMLPGYVMGRTFLVNMADKLGIGIEEWRFLKYKSAMESLVRHEMSEADREQRQALVDQYYATMRADVAEGRGVGSDTVDRWVDDLVLFTARQALDEKVVDALGRWEDVDEVVKELEGKRKQMISASQLDHAWYPSKQWGETPIIALVYAIGGCDMDTGIRARELEKTLVRLRKDREVKAVVLRVDSPGGSALASDVVAGQLKKCMKEKPVVISQGDVAASGGYWLSMCSSRIVSQPTTITGSIGVIAGWVWDKGIGEKTGMEGDFVRAGKHADLFFSLRPPFLPIAIPHRTVTDDERERVLIGMKQMYAEFVDKVAENRRMTPERVEELAQGRVWTGAAATQNGLVDEIGGVADAIATARKLAGIGVDDDAKVVEFGSRGLFRWDVPGLSFRSPLASAGALMGARPLEAALARWLRRGETTDAGDPGHAAPVPQYDLIYLEQLIRNNGRAQCLLPPDMVPRDGSDTAVN